jgi:hypothetical protein
MRVVGRVFLLVCGAMLGCGVVPPVRETQAPAEALVGLWGSEQTLGPAVRGELVVEVRGAEWHATIAGQDMLGEREGNRVTFRLPENQGEFRGWIEGTPATESGGMQGHWI